jgi:diaminohydroxyphosphoribosylaminopyrimidine deaminase/5-amino-6-(5-phosphoribosylamino)uracil reductase
MTGSVEPDESWMRLALAEARKGVGHTAPNPPVGAVVVKDGVLLGTGWHRAAGLPHAEREALADALARHAAAAVRGSTVYVTLEPCSTHGRTPPCTAGLIEAGVARVVYACVDENPAHAGRADEVLTTAGIEVTAGVLAGEAREILRPFFKVRATGLPWVLWKTAMSLDGRLTRPPGEGMWLTGTEARARVQRLRAEMDAILTSGETVRRDKPQLAIRDPQLLAGRPQPWRVVLTRNPSTLPADAPLFTDEWRERTLVMDGDPESVLRKLLVDRGVLALMIEAGGVLAGEFLRAGLVDEVVAFLSPVICGGPVTAAAGLPPDEPLRLHSIRYDRRGEDMEMRGLIVNEGARTD